MQEKLLISIFIVVICVLLANRAVAGDLSGVWTKTTHPDANNITLLIADGMNVKAIGYGIVSGKSAMWFAEGRLAGNRLICDYRYAEDATPPGWQRAGTMTLVISEDGRSMSGTATSTSGDWSGRIEFRRLRP